MFFLSRLLLIVTALFSCSLFASHELDSLAFEHACRRIESLNFEERTQGTPNDRVLYLLGQYQECLLRFLREAESEQIFLEGMRELFYRSAKVQHGCFYSVDSLKHYRFTDPTMESHTVEVNYEGHPCEAFYNSFKSNTRWTEEERETLYQIEEEHYLRDAEVPVKIWGKDTPSILKPNTIYNFVLLPDDTVRYAEERLGAREYHLATDDTVTEKFSHPNHSMLAGSANQIVISAGAFSFVEHGNKRLYFVSNKSGHYRPFLFSLGEFREWLGRHGIDEATVILLPDLEVARVLVENYDSASLIGDDPQYYWYYYCNYSNGIPIAVNEAEAAILLDTARRQWLHLEDDIDVAFLEALARGDNSLLTPNTIAALNGARERLNYMRCAYKLLLETHEVPESFDRLVTRLGKLKDAILHQVSKRMVLEAQHCLQALEKHRSISEEALRVCDEESFYAYVRAKKDRINWLRYQDELDIKSYHELKKAIRELAVLFRLLNTAPLPVEKENSLLYQAVSEAFFCLNNEMTVVHDRYVGARMRGEVEGDVYVVLPDDLIVNLERYLEYVSLEPPKLNLDLTQLSARHLLHRAASTWRMTHANFILKEGVKRALEQLVHGQPVEICPNFLQWLVIARHAADAMARMCAIFETEQLAPESTLWYIRQIDRILAAIPDRTPQTLEIVVEDMAPFLIDGFAKESLDATSGKKMNASLHELVEGIRLLATHEELSPEKWDRVYDQVASLVVVVDMIKKTHYYGKKHRYEVYDSLSRILAALVAQLDHERRLHGSSSITIGPEVRRLAAKAAIKLANY